MKKIKIIALVFLTGSLSCFSQINSQENNIAIDDFDGISQESIFVHYNTNLLFTGEQFLYKMYCFDDENKQLSQISKIAYIELIAKDKTIVFKHKIRLNSGISDGDFFVPASIPTGSYKLFAYTQWMQNKGHESFFEADLVIINPYQKTPGEYVERDRDTLIRKENSDLLFQENDILNKDLNQILSIDKIEIGKRKKLMVTVDNSNSIIANGNYSLSVRKTNELINYPTQNAVRFFEDLKKLPNRKKTQDLFFIPELRGELISGVITNKENNSPVINEKIGLSLPGKNYLFKISTTNELGHFYFNLDTPYDNSSGILQQLSGDWKNRDISFYENKVDYKVLNFKSFFLNSSMKEQIEERSIQNQIENAYVSLKLDMTQEIKQGLPFYRQIEKVYDLDDYTRFNSIKETIVEVVNLVSIKKEGNGNRVFEVRLPEGVQSNGFPLMLFVDGVYIKKHEDFMNYSARKIKTIGFSNNNNYLIESLSFQGVLSITTIDGDFNKTFYADYLKEVELFEPEKKKKYFSQNYDDTANKKWERIPDFRRQLLWIPEMKLKDKEVIELYTSDINGNYKISLEGFTSNGTPVSISKTFKVE